MDVNQFTGEEGHIWEFSSLDVLTIQYCKLERRVAEEQEFCEQFEKSLRESYSEKENLENNIASLNARISRARETCKQQTATKENLSLSLTHLRNRLADARSKMREEETRLLELKEKLSHLTLSYQQSISDIKEKYRPRLTLNQTFSEQMQLMKKKRLLKNEISEHLKGMEGVNMDGKCPLDLKWEEFCNLVVALASSATELNRTITSSCEINGQLKNELDAKAAEKRITASLRDTNSENYFFEKQQSCIPTSTSSSLFLSKGIEKQHSFLPTTSSPSLKNVNDSSQNQLIAIEERKRPSTFTNLFSKLSLPKLGRFSWQSKSQQANASCEGCDPIPSVVPSSMEISGDVSLCISNPEETSIVATPSYVEAAIISPAVVSEVIHFVDTECASAISDSDVALNTSFVEETTEETHELLLVENADVGISLSNNASEDEEMETSQAGMPCDTSENYVNYSVVVEPPESGNVSVSSFSERNEPLCNSSPKRALTTSTAAEENVHSFMQLSASPPPSSGFTTLTSPPPYSSFATPSSPPPSSSFTTLTSPPPYSSFATPSSPPPSSSFTSPISPPPSSNFTLSSLFSSTSLPGNEKSTSSSGFFNFFGSGSDQKETTSETSSSFRLFGSPGPSDSSKTPTFSLFGSSDKDSSEDSGFLNFSSGAKSSTEGNFLSLFSGSGSSESHGFKFF